MTSFTAQDRVVLYQSVREMCDQWISENYKFLKAQNLIEINNSSLHNIFTFNLGALSDKAQSEANLATSMERFARLNVVNDVDKSVIRIAELATRITYCVGDRYMEELKFLFKKEMQAYFLWSPKHQKRMLTMYPWLFLHPILSESWEKALNGKL